MHYITVIMVISKIASGRHGRVTGVPRTLGLVAIGLFVVESLPQAQAASSVTLAWNPSPSSGITGYRLHYGFSSGSYQVVIDVGNTTIATVQNLTAGQTYYFVVTAYNSLGLQSGPSNQVAFTSAPNPLLVQSTPPQLTIATVPNPPDFDGDGKQDLLWRNSSTGQVGLWLMNGPSPKATVVLGSPLLSWKIINTGDFDGDGESDILWQFVNSSQYGVWFMDGTRIAGIQNFSLPSYAGQICCASDFDGDGLTDLVTFNRIAGKIYFWKNYGSLQFVQQTSYAVSSASGWLPVGATELSGPSASMAVIWRNANTGEVAAWFMSGFNWSSAASFGNPGTAVQLCGFGDFSGDGKKDLLLFNTFNNVVGYWRTNGAQVPSSVPLARASGSWVPVGAEDLSGSGNADIIWRQTSTGALGAWEVNGSAISTAIGSLLVGQNWQLQPQAITP